RGGDGLADQVGRGRLRRRKRTGSRSLRRRRRRRCRNHRNLGTRSSVSPERPMTGDEIILTIPGEQSFREVAHLVLGGVAARLDLTFEAIDDLDAALDALLGRTPAAGTVTLPP